MLTPEDRKNLILSYNPRYTHIADFERCETLEQLRQVMEEINRNQYQLVSVTQDNWDVYTVFFRRCVVG